MCVWPNYPMPNTTIRLSWFYDSPNIDRLCAVGANVIWTRKRIIPENRQSSFAHLIKSVDHWAIERTCIFQRFFRSPFIFNELITPSTLFGYEIMESKQCAYSNTIWLRQRIESNDCSIVIERHRFECTLRTIIRFELKTERRAVEKNRPKYYTFFFSLHIYNKRAMKTIEMCVHSSAQM